MPNAKRQVKLSREKKVARHMSRTPTHARPDGGEQASHLLIFQVLPASMWVKVEAAAVEVDCGLEVLAVAKAAGGVAPSMFC